MCFASIFFPPACTFHFVSFSRSIRFFFWWLCVIETLWNGKMKFYLQTFSLGISLLARYSKEFFKITLTVEKGTSCQHSLTSRIFSHNYFVREENVYFLSLVDSNQFVEGEIEISFFARGAVIFCRHSVLMIQSRGHKMLMVLLLVWARIVGL